MFRHFQFKELDDNTPPSSLVKKLQVWFAVCGLGFTLAVATHFSALRVGFDTTVGDTDGKVLGCSDWLDHCDDVNDELLSCDGVTCEHVEESPTSRLR